MRNSGFSLIELVVAVGVVGILASIAIPSYTMYVQRTNRLDAIRTMTYDAQALERCYSLQFAYTPCPAVNMPSAPSPQGYYTITVAVTAGVPNVSAPTYTVTAVPLASPQLADTACAVFTLDNTGLQQATDASSTDTTKTCWGST